MLKSSAPKEQYPAKVQYSKAAIIQFLEHITRNPLTPIAISLIVLFIVVAVLAPLIAPYDPLEIQSWRVIAGERTYPPFPISTEHWFGTDQLGRDIFSRVIYGLRTSLFVGLVARGLSMLVGVALGLLAGYLGGAIETTIMRATDISLAFPPLLLAMIVTAVLGPSIWTVCAAIVLVGWPDVTRLVRSQVLTIKREVYVEAVKAIGAGNPRIILQHVLPNCLGPILVAFSMGIPGAVMYEAGLSFFGLGVQPPTPSLGSIIADGRGYIMFAPWYSLFPGIVLSLFVLSFNIIGDALIDKLDPSRTHTKFRGSPGV